MVGRRIIETKERSKVGNKAGHGYGKGGTLRRTNDRKQRNIRKY